MKKPKHNQSEREPQNESAKQSVSKPAGGLQKKKIFEVWRKGSYEQCRKYKVEASKRQGGGTVRKGERHLDIIT